MQFIALLLSFLININAPSLFLCDGESLKATIINNENGDFTRINDLEKIDAGAFILIDWKVKLMLPRTFLANEYSFSDNKWKWIYDSPNSPRLIESKPSGQIVEHLCYNHS